MRGRDTVALFGPASFSTRTEAPLCNCARCHASWTYAAGRTRGPDPEWGRRATGRVPRVLPHVRLRRSTLVLGGLAPSVRTEPLAEGLVEVDFGSADLKRPKTAFRLFRKGLFSWKETGGVKWLRWTLLFGAWPAPWGNWLDTSPTRWRAPCSGAGQPRGGEGHAWQWDKGAASEPLPHMQHPVCACAQPGPAHAAITSAWRGRGRRRPHVLGGVRCNASRS